MQTKPKVLIVEDEENIRHGLRDFLEFKDFDVTTACDGLQAERICGEGTFDIILLDLMLPRISGEQLCMKWRQEGLGTPVIMLTAKGQEKEKIAGLDLGADDYVTKPFSLEELLARIRAVLRRSDPAMRVTGKFRFGSVEVDISAMKIYDGEIETALSRRECDLIRYFAANAGRVLSREELYEKVWAESMGEIETRTVDMHIAKLRSKIEDGSCEPKVIRTVRGAGYVYEG